MTRPPEIRPRRLGTEGALSGDLVRGRERALSLLPGEGRERDSRAGGRSGQGRVDADAFRTTTAEARRRLARILDGDGVLVSTGQQPVLFLGPLYVLYKALTALQLAREVRQATGKPALAVFWVASDDHDWREVGGTRLLDRENRLREARLDPPSGRAERSVGPTRLPEEIDEVLSDAFQSLPESEFVQEYLELFRDAYRPGRPVAEAFGLALTGLLGERPLAWLDTAREEVKRAAAPLFRRALEDAAGGETALRRGADRLRKAGYEVQIPVLEGATHLFYDTDRARVRLYRAGDGGLRLGREGPRVDRAEVEDELAREPGRFSPNVALRPVLESWLLPTAYAVGGPGELAYWTQLGPLFEHRGVPMPALRPRHSWTVLEDKVAKVLRKVEAGPREFRDGGEQLVRRAISDSRPDRVNDALGELRSAIHGAVVDVEEALQRQLPGIQASVGKARSELFEAVDRLEEAVDGRVEERQEVVVRQIRKAAVHLYPEGAPQERVLNPLYYLARYGEAFLEAVEEAGRRRPVLPRSRSDA